MIAPIRMKTIPRFQMAGIREITSAANLNPSVVWKKFMPLLKHLEPVRTDQDLYALQFYNAPPGTPGYDPGAEFEFWAAARIQPGDQDLPREMSGCSIHEGLYAVFLHQGPAAAFGKTLGAIYNTWLPASGYEIDQRMHFQVMGPDYKGPLHPDAEEEVWIPIK